MWMVHFNYLFYTRFIGIEQRARLHVFWDQFEASPECVKVSESSQSHWLVGLFEVT